MKKKKINIMNNKEFKEIVYGILKKNGMNGKRNSYHFETKEALIIIACQKSNYSNGYYINYGFLVKSINDNIENAKVNLCDVIGRFDGNENDIFNLDSLEEKKLEEIVQENFDGIIRPVIEFGVCKYFENYPEAIWTAKLKLKEYLQKGRK